jgi:hypothetical protein
MPKVKSTNLIPYVNDVQTNAPSTIVTDPVPSVFGMPEFWKLRLSLVSLNPNGSKVPPSIGLKVLEICRSIL